MKSLITLDSEDMITTMINIYDEIKKERDYQQDRWGNVSDDTLNTPWMWVAYIVQYAGSWMSGSFLPLSKDSVDSFRKAMIKVATLAIAAIESVDRQRAANSKTFYESE